MSHHRDPVAPAAPTACDWLRAIADGRATEQRGLPLPGGNR